ncbi:MAG: ethanolamine ammonia-lyase subunit EutC [Propionibacteriaceae bacterium]|jgi:ethanolamine ammonia-lyase small subunit|nr:ethanolamine ammonia-lyase subunit EutC [Propionibacteriaceae bacterium]
MSYSETDIKAMVSQILGELAGPATPATPAAGPVAAETPLTPEQLIAVPHPANLAALQEMVRATPARIGEWRAGPRPTCASLLRFRADHAAAMDAVFNDVSEDLPAKLGLLSVQSAAPDKAAYLMDPALGAEFTPETQQLLKDRCPRGAQVQIIVSDGLSSTAVESNLPDLFPALTQGLKRHGLGTGTNLFVKYGRVRVMDAVSGLLAPEVTLILLGERPGLVTNESLSCYMTYKGYPGAPENIRTVVSNIYRQGTPPAEAGAYIADIAQKMLSAKASGMDLKL